MKKKVFTITALAAMLVSGCAVSEINTSAALQRALQEAEEVTVRAMEAEYDRIIAEINE